MEERKSGISRREFLAAASALAAGGLLAACAPAKTPAPPAPAKEEEAAPKPTAVPAEKEAITFQYWVFWGQLADCEEAWRATDEWKEMQGDNTIEFRVGMGGDAGLTAVAGGTPPDIGDLGHQLDFMLKGVLLPIDDLVGSSSIVSPEKFFEGNWKSGGWEGVQYGVPAHECFIRRGLCYNARMIEEAGLDPDNVPVTWEELLEWHKKLTKFDSAGNLLQMGLDPYDAEGGTGPGMDGFTMADSWGFQWFDAETGKFNLDHEKMAEAFEMMGEFIRVVGPDNLAGLRSVEGQGTWGGAFNAEVQAMLIEGYWHPGETVHEKPEVSEVNRATWAPVPASRKDARYQFAGGHTTFLFREAEHPLEAWPIMEWLQSDACCDIIFKTIGWLPGLKSYVDNVGAACKANPADFSPGLEFYFRSVDEANEWYEWAMCPIGSFANTKKTELREAVYRDEMSGAEAAAKFQEVCEQEWKEAGYG